MQPETRIYELINMSDAVCFETADEEALCVAVLLLGSGRYGLECGDRKVLGLAMFGAAAEKAAERAAEFLSVPGNGARCAAALRTAIYCSPSERRALAAAFEALPPEARQKALTKFNDERRSSLNDIGQACEHLASGLEKA